MTDAVTAYAGVRVLDCSEGIPGPTATMYLADLGADVVKVEPPRGDRLASDPAYRRANRGKRRTVLDPADHRDRGELRRLVGAATCVVFDWEQAELERVGMDAATVRAAHPSVVHAWLPNLAPVGRWSHLPADPLVLAAVSGISDYHRAMSERPVSPVVPVISYAHGALAAAGIGAALLERRRSGAGRSLVVSGLHAVAAMQAAVVVDARGLMSPGQEPKRGIAALPNYAPYECADGRWLYLGALTQAFFLNALDVLDLIELMALPGVDGEFANVVQPDIAPKLIGRMQERFAQRPMHEWLEALDSAGVPVAPVMVREEWFASPTVEANGMRVVAHDPDVGRVELPGVPVVLSTTPGTVGPACAGEVRSTTCWTDGAAETNDAGSAGTNPAADTATAPAADAGSAGTNPAADASSAGTDPAGVAAERDRPLPLDGLRVVDSASFVAGTFGPSILAHFGASVTKVEPLDGDPYRLFSVSFAAINQGKRGISIDLKQPQGIEAVRRMVACADVFVDNLREEPRQRLGLDWARTRALNERLVHCSVTAYGAGPLSEKPGFDPLLQARSGLMAAQGGDDEPSMSSMLVHDIATGAMAAVGILAALYHREHSGCGQHVRTSLAHSSFMLQAGEFTRYVGRPAAARGGRDWPGPDPRHRLYPCADGWIFLAAGDADADEVRAALALPPVAGPLDSDAVTEATSALTVDEALDRLGAASIPAAKVLSRHEVFTDPWLHANRFFHLVTDSVLGPCRVVRTVAEWPDSTTTARARSFALGEDTIEVLADHGLDAEAIEALIATGVVRARGRVDG